MSMKHEYDITIKVREAEIVRLDSRIRELEAEIEALLQDRSDVCGTIGTALGLDESTLFSRVCMVAWDFIRRINRAAGDEDPLTLIEAAKNLPMTADGVTMRLDAMGLIHSLAQKSKPLSGGA